MTRLVVHLIDANADTAYFRAIARHTDAGQVSVAIGCLAANRCTLM